MSASERRIALSDHSANHGALGCYPANRGPMGQTIDSALGEALPGIFPHVAVGYAPRHGLEDIVREVIAWKRGGWA